MLDNKSDLFPFNYKFTKFFFRCRSHDDYCLISVRCQSLIDNQTKNNDPGEESCKRIKENVAFIRTEEEVISLLISLLAQVNSLTLNWQYFTGIMCCVVYTFVHFVLISKFIINSYFFREHVVFM